MKTDLGYFVDLRPIGSTVHLWTAFVGLVIIQQSIRLLSADFTELLTGLSTKDYVAPTSFVFKNGKDFEMGGTMGAVSYLQILAPELTDKMLAEFLEMDSNLMVNFHIQSIDQMKAIKLVKSKVTDINRMKIEEQKKAVRAGYDMDISATRS